MKEVLQFFKENTELTYLTVILLVLIVERWLGRTLKVKEASILDILLARVLRIPLPPSPAELNPPVVKPEQPEEKKDA